MTDRGLRAAAAALVVIAGIWAGARVYLSRQAISAHPAGVATPVGRASPPTSSDALDEPLAGLADTVKIPDRLPPFALKDVDGRLTPIKRWDGRSLVINFWATWCAPCRREIPMLIELSAAWAERDVTVLGIAVDHPDAVAGFARQFKIPYPLLVGEQDALDVAGQLGVITPVFPFTVFTDRRGEVVALYIGELHRPQAELILGVVRNVDEEQMPLAEARRTITQGLRSLPPQDKSG